MSALISWVAKSPRDNPSEPLSIDFPGNRLRRSVQNRRILRLQGADGQETIIVAREDDDVSSVATTTETTQPASRSGGHAAKERATKA